MPDLLGEVIVAIILALVGIFSIARKRFSMEFGRRGFLRFFNAQPIFTFTLTESRAILFGWVSLISGLVVLGLCVYVFVTLDKSIVEQGITLVIAVLAASATLITFLFESFIEFLVHVKENRKD
jgi:hypothetical protein